MMKKMKFKDAKEVLEKNIKEDFIDCEVLDVKAVKNCPGCFKIKLKRRINFIQKLLGISTILRLCEDCHDYYLEEPEAEKEGYSKYRVWVAYMRAKQSI